MSYLFPRIEATAGEEVLTSVPVVSKESKVDTVDLKIHAPSGDEVANIIERRRTFLAGRSTSNNTSRDVQKNSPTSPLFDFQRSSK